MRFRAADEANAARPTSRTPEATSPSSELTLMPVTVLLGLKYVSAAIDAESTTSATDQQRGSAGGAALAQPVEGAGSQRLTQHRVPLSSSTGEQGSSTTPLRASASPAT